MSSCARKLRVGANAYFTLNILLGLLLIVSESAFAELIVNGNFESNDFDFAIFADYWQSFCPYGWELK